MKYRWSRNRREKWKPRVDDWIIDSQRNLTRIISLLDYGYIEDQDSFIHHFTEVVPRFSIFSEYNCVQF